MINPIEIKNFLNYEECDFIIELLHSFNFKPAKAIYEGNIIESFDLHKREIAHLKSYDFNDVFKNLSDNILNKINSLNIFKGLKYDNIVKFDFSKYSEKDYINHHIDSDEINHGATITVVLELSNNYDGGEFCYIYNDNEFQFEKEKGSLYIFDSNTLHKVTPIINGIRYSINCWPKYSTNKTLI